MIKGIIFDFDGVIVDTETKKFSDLRGIMRKKGYSISNDIFPDFVGKKTFFFLNEKFPDISKKDFEDIMNKRRKLQHEQIGKNKLIAGIENLLYFLKKNNIKIGIATGSGKEFVEKILEINKIKDFFDFLVTGEDFSSSKPDPECFLKAIEKIKLPKEEIIIIEDSIAGITAAKSIDVKVFAIRTYLKNEELQKADKIFKNHFDLLEEIKTIIR